MLNAGPGMCNLEGLGAWRAQRRKNFSGFAKKWGWGKAEKNRERRAGSGAHGTENSRPSEVSHGKIEGGNNPGGKGGIKRAENRG